MKKIIKRTLVSFLIFVFSLAPISPQVFLNFSQAEAIDIADVDLENIAEDIIIPENTKFIIEEGMHVNFAQDGINIIVEGELQINGTQDNPVFIGEANTQKGFSINTKPGSKLFIRNATITGGSHMIEGGGYLNFIKKALADNFVGAIQIDGGDVDIKGVRFLSNKYAIVASEEFQGNLNVNYSKFIDNDWDVSNINGADFTNNYWDDDNFEDPFCPEDGYYWVSACLYKAIGDFEIYPWQTDINFTCGEECNIDIPETSGASSVLFLPGVEASRLYEKDDKLGEYRLWEPRDRVEDLQRLYLDKNGDSVSDGIYTKDIVDDFFGIVDIYDGFISYMDSLVIDKTIKEWKPIPYDWRLPLEDIVDGKIKLEDGEMNIIEELETLAGNSNTGKVTIVGHSNGGLLGKVIIDRLKIAGKENLVDKFIMVATPQVGTPKAIAGLLHGDKVGIPMTMLNNIPGNPLVLPVRLEKV